MLRDRLPLLFTCLIVAAALVAAPEAKATGNVLALFSIPNVCPDVIPTVYADVDGDPTTGAWVGGVWYPNETQISIYPYWDNSPTNTLSGDLQDLGNGLFFSYIAANGPGCSGTINQWATLTGRFLIRFIDVMAPGWVWNNPSTWSERYLTEAQLKMSNDGCGNYIVYPGTPNPNPYMQVRAYQHWNGGNLQDSANAGPAGAWEGSLTSSTGFSELVFRTDFCENILFYLNLFDTPVGEIFSDGFESGSTSAWSSTVP